jgi:hypothetical protein
VRGGCLSDPCNPEKGGPGRRNNKNDLILKTEEIVCVVQVYPKKGETMINRKLRAMLLTLSFLGAPFMKAKPFTWAPVGVDVDAEGYALSSVSPDLYNYGDLIDETPGDFNSSFASTPEDCILDIYGTLRDPESADADGDGVPDEEILDADGNPIFASLKIDGDVRLDARLCNGCDMTVNINTDVAIEPYSNSAGVTQIEGSTTGVFAGSDGLCYSQVYFNAEAGRSICVNVDNNLEFRGRTVDPATEDFTDMIVTFNGQGRVFFKLADGTGVFFNGQIDDTTPILVDVSTVTKPCHLRSMRQVKRLSPACSTQVVQEPRCISPWIKLSIK